MCVCVGGGGGGGGECVCVCVCVCVRVWPTLTCVHVEVKGMIVTVHRVTEVHSNMVVSIHGQVQVIQQWLLRLVVDLSTGDVGLESFVDQVRTSAGSTVGVDHAPAERHRETAETQSTVTHTIGTT